MSEQTILPFAQWGFPPEDAERLALANAVEPRGDFSWPRTWRSDWKQRWFYPLKDRILKLHAVPDGYDVQVLYQSCHSCFNGIWRSECGRFRDICWHCHGTGVFRRDAVELSRWWLAGAMFHRPVTYERGVTDELLNAWKAGATNVFAGKIKHAPVLEETGRAAFLHLLRRYDPGAYSDLLDIRVRERVEAITAWLLQPWKRWINRGWGWLHESESRWAEGLREWYGVERWDIPF